MNPPNECLLAIDLSLDRLDVFLRDPAGRWLIPHQRFPHNWSGFQALKQTLLDHLGPLGPVQLTVAGESTGNLWWHLFYHISTDPATQSLSPRLALLNPSHVKHYRKALPEQDKADRSDPQLVAAYYDQVGIRHPYRFYPRYLPLRQITRSYHRLVHTIAAEKAYLLSLAYLWASEYVRKPPFSDLFGVTSSHLLSDYPDTAALANLPLEELAATLQHHARGAFSDPAQNARQVQQAFHDSYPLPPFLAPTVHALLQQGLERIGFLEDQQKTLRGLIEEQLADLPEADLALAEPGLGPVLVGGCLGEIQDTRRFTTGTKYDRRKKRHRPRRYRDGQAAVANMAGLWWPRNSSGRFEGHDRHLARERNPYLRYWFVQSAYCLKRHQEEYAAYYQRKYNESNRHPHKRALVLTARKAVRMIFALLYKGQQRWLEEQAIEH